MSDGDRASDALDRFWNALVEPSGDDPKKVRRELGDAVDGSSFALLEDLNDMRLLLDDDATIPIWMDTTPGQRRDISDDIEPGMAIGDYTIIRRLGRGGMGVVFAAHQHALGREVALKLIRLGPLSTKEDLARFNAESLAAASLKHPGVVSVYDSGDWHGYHFFSMELVDGPTLSGLLREGPVESQRALRFVRQICDAVGHAHEQGILHRDLKPSNVLVDRNDQARIMDFGLAKLFSGEDDESLTRSGAMVGTPSYMSPEQALGDSKRVTPQSDIYSIGAILYELLTGRAPFRAATPVETMRQVVDQEPAAPRALHSGVSRDVETICLKCLEKDPDKRYASTAALSADLQNVQSGRPISARPLSAVGRAWRWCNRNPALATALGLLLASLLAGTVVSTAMWRISEANVKMANEQLVIAEQANAVAKREVENAAAVTQFFTQDVLGQASPNASPDREIKLSAVLDAAAKTLENQFPNEPLIEAAVRQSLGETYMSLGKLNECQSHLLRAVELRREALGEGHPDTIDAMHKVGMFYYSNGRYEDAEKQYVKVIDVSSRALGNDHPGTLSAQGQLAHALYWQHRYDEAEPIYVKVLAAQEASGQDDISTLVTRNNLAILYGATQRFEDAERLLLKNLAAQRRILGDTHLDTMTSLNNLGYMHNASGDYEKALPYFQEALASRRRVLGDHQHTCFSIHNLGLYHWLQGQHEAALPYFQEAYEMRRQVSGEDHPNTQISQRRLCDLLIEVGRAEKALPYAQRAVAWTTQNTPGQWTEEFARALHGAALAGTGDFAAGENLLLEGYRALADRPEEIDRLERKLVLGACRRRLVSLYSAWGKPEEAAKWETPVD